MNQRNNVYEDLRVLIVDDHMIIRNLISQNLRDIGISRIKLAEDGDDAIEKIEHAISVVQPFDIVFLDWNMPNKNGIDVLKACRKNSKCDSTAFIMLTAKNEQADVVTAIEAGATSYVAKPTTQSQIHRHIEKTMDWLKEQNTLKSKNTKKLKQNTGNSAKIPTETLVGLEPIITKGMKNIFSSLFQVEIVPDDHIHASDQEDMICIGTLYQEDVKIDLRFVFCRKLLKPLLQQLYSSEYLEGTDIYEDAACEIVNILCNQVKTFLNKHGYHLNFDLPHMYNENSIRDDNTASMNVAFTLSEDETFYIDVRSE